MTAMLPPVCITDVAEAGITDNILWLYLRLSDDSLALAKIAVNDIRIEHVEDLVRVVH